MKKLVLMKKVFLILIFFLILNSLLSAQNEENHLYLDNGIIRVGVDLSRGGAIDYLAESSNPEKNYINRFDAGRLVQRSCFGPPFIYNACPGFLNWPWNPVQGGDCFDNGSPVIDFKKEANLIYTKCIPLNWGSNNELTDSIIETWINLEGRAVRIESRFTNGGEDHSRWMDQELLAVYVITELSNLWFYGGEYPFTWDRLTVLKPPSKNIYYQATEYWAAWTDEYQFGVGVFSQDMMYHTAFRVGEQGKTDDYAFDTNYVGIISRFTVPPYSVHHGVSYLILDTLYNIRKFVYKKVRYPSGQRLRRLTKRYREPNEFGILRWEFNKPNDREGWAVGWDYKNKRNSLDDTFGVINGVWRLIARSSQGKGSYIISPQFQLFANYYDWIEIRIRFESSMLDKIRLYWNRLSNEIFKFPEENSISIDVIADGEWHTYYINVGQHPYWKGTIRQLCLAELGSNNKVEIDYIRIWQAPKWSSLSFK
ncbi:hypothetical protein NLC82_01215 [Candidatus Aminicenantes bacterium AC-335-A11]|jgi:hypothetical protein|nr:hypothetical protein [SCandidatus Aminicenantes bacterium Aminicenantia_JdfR_composite]MCP2597304.1 hypothetical protein [Candidatus Aminicenantes bacterium AC-335-G13]MCP2598098.1 hypothetical protein [Candidatus Aminicenantes bacterium AC-335-L06]MCP2606238.1 hypothetical protein [Candidatus Aminicenantes bacterium AC-708-I09]MCP2618022.1 hypothetical protein [Candidatus Aminicenantes bacterium AC-335-A11]